MRAVGADDEAGIIPAYAGSTYNEVAYRTEAMGSSPHTRGAPSALIEAPSGAWDHPRIRGEHRPFITFCVRRVGIIPAYAGSTCFSHVSTARK